MCIVRVVDLSKPIAPPIRASSTISSVDVRRPESWTHAWFLTIDVDWAPDEVIADTIELLQGFGVASTWMVTHETRLLSELRGAPNIELGIHPNFNGLLEGQHFRGHASAKAVIEDLFTLVPEAKVLRSHSVVQSSPLLDLCAEHGLSHDVNMFIPSGSANILSPWRSWNGMTRVPYVWEDDVWCLYESTDQRERSPSELYTSHQGIVVINFHPIHVYLNTEKLERYESLRHLHHDAKALLDYRFEGYGTRNRLVDLLTIASSL